LTSKIARGAGLLGAGIFAGTLALGLSAMPASAQPLPPYYPGVAVYPGYMPGLPPHQVVAVVRSTGLEPLSGPMRHGLTYSVRAVDPAGREYRVIVDARIGRVLRAVPLPGPYYAGPAVPPYGYPVGPGAMADGYGPSSRIAALPPGPGGPPMNGAVGVPGGSAPGANTAPHPKVQAGPPLPRPRPKLAATDSSAPTGAPPQAAQAPAAPAPGTIKETNDTTGAVPPPAPAPAAAPPAPAAAPPTPPSLPDELHE
jgi:hypothetical protein